MAVEKLGVWEDPSPDDGPGPGHHIRGGEATEEEAFAWLPLHQPEKPQLLGLQILLLWATGAHKCYRLVQWLCQRWVHSRSKFVLWASTPPPIQSEEWTRVWYTPLLRSWVGMKWTLEMLWSGMPGFFSTDCRQVDQVDLHEFLSFLSIFSLFPCVLWIFQTT